MTLDFTIVQVAKTSQGLFPQSFWISENKERFVDANIHINSINTIELIELIIKNYN